MEAFHLEQRLVALETRLSSIETQLKNAKAIPIVDDEWSESPSASISLSRPAGDHVNGSYKSGNWLGIIAVICFVVAAGFIIKLSIDSGWLTPDRQLGLSGLLGISLVGGGLRLLNSDRQYASFLPASGVIILYVTVFAAGRYYAVLPFEMAIGATAVISAFCIWLYLRIQHDAYPLIASVGAYAAPIILGLNPEAVFPLYYFIVCSLAFAAIAVWMQSRTLILVSAYLAIVVTSWVGWELRHDMLVASILAIHFVIFSLDTYFYTRHHSAPLRQDEAWFFLPVLLIFYTLEYHFIGQVRPGLAPWISLEFAGVLIGLYLSAKIYFPTGLTSQSLILAFASIVGFHSIYIELLPVDVRPWLFVVIMLGVPLLLTYRMRRPSGNSFDIPILSLYAIIVIEYISVIAHLLQVHDHSWLAVSFASAASMWLLIVMGRNNLSKLSALHPVLCAAHILVVIALYRLTTEYGSLAVSASWLFYAVSIVWLGFIRQDETMAKSALFVLGFAAGKALLYDAASAPTSVRILCLLLTGAVLYSCGFFMRKISGWKVPKDIA